MIRPRAHCLGLALLLAPPGGAAKHLDSRIAEPAQHSGTVHFSISCTPRAQGKFNDAVTLLHHMTYTQARAAFREVATLDPTCAMAYWGIAMTLFQPLWPTRPGPEALQQGWEAVQRADALHPATPREQRFVAAARAFFLEPASPDYWLRIGRWERAQQELYAAFPGDDEAAAFYALAHLATAPADDPREARAHADRAAEILLAVHRRSPDHPGAMHYLIHADDTPGREGQELEITHGYETLAPDNPHALHMPTHIYTRLGDWDGVIRGNLRAADAALRYPAGDHGELVWDEFPHTMEYLIYAYLQEGADQQASEQLRRLLSTAHLEPSFKTAFHVASTQARYALERRAWGEAAGLAPRAPATIDWDRFAWPEAITWFARGLGAAHLGRADDARAARSRLEQLEAKSEQTGEALFTRNVRMLRLELTAWIAHMDQREDSSTALLRDAAELEATTPKAPVTPGPTLPAQELLGDLLMEQQQPAAALAAYRRSLDQYPRRLNALLGAARAARALGDEELARTFYRQVLDVAAGGTRQAVLQEARDYSAAQARPHFHHLPATPTTVAWGYYWAGAKPALRVASGDTVEVETLLTSLPDRLERAGVAPGDVQQSLRDIATNVTDKGPGGHILTGPIYVEGAEPGDALEVRILSIDLAIPYGYNGCSGFLKENCAEPRTRIIQLDRTHMTATLDSGITIPLHPFFGSMGDAPPPEAGRVSSNPPGTHAGNLDNKELVTGSTLYIPVHAAGALFEIGDGHAAQGDGEVDQTAIETSLTGRVQLIVRKDLHLSWPRAETPTDYIAMGADSDLTKATQIAVQQAVNLVMELKHLPRVEAYRLVSIAGNVRITELVDGTMGVHVMIPKAIFSR